MFKAPAFVVSSRRSADSPSAVKPVVKRLIPPAFSPAPTIRHLIDLGVADLLKEWWHERYPWTDLSLAHPTRTQFHR